MPTSKIKKNHSHCRYCGKALPPYWRYFHWDYDHKNGHHASRAKGHDNEDYDWNCGTAFALKYDLSGYEAHEKMLTKHYRPV